jgi:hypothetical protein
VELTYHTPKLHGVLLVFPRIGIAGSMPCLAAWKCGGASSLERARDAARNSQKSVR